jgi:hypothetical protein
MVWSSVDQDEISNSMAHLHAVLLADRSKSRAAASAALHVPSLAAATTGEYALPIPCTSTTLHDSEGVYMAETAQ